jgi:murein DD-endopeptidase MepM/ murein hydrolase activator NlpD
MTTSFRLPPRLLVAVLPALVLVVLVPFGSAGAAARELATTHAFRSAPPAPPWYGAPVTRPASGVWPLQPRPAVVHRFDPPEVRWGRGHRGVDLAGRVGQAVRAAVAGRVTFVGRIAGVGTVVVGHGATRTTYQPVDPTVARGDPVAAGQRIGSLAWLGTHCSPASCLHWGLLRGETYLDPLTLVDAPSPVRLLPAA